jgi:hypothetical protein
MLFWSASTTHFYHRDIHGQAVPADAVTVTPARHRALLDGQRSGRDIIVGADGKPTLTPALRMTAALAREYAGIDIRVEARRRILAVASLEQQSNDNAVLALHTLAMATGDEFDAALGRRSMIDAIRAASNALEAKISAWSAAALDNLNVRDDAHWPAGE